jgi:hypothetical protein
MTESHADLIRRLSRLLKEELQPHAIGFALVVAIPRDDSSVNLGITSNIEPADIVALLERTAFGIKTKPNINLVDAGDRQEGHA